VTSCSVHIKGQACARTPTEVNDESLPHDTIEGALCFDWEIVPGNG